MKDRINIRNLLRAFSAIEDRFPYFKVQLKKGFFWYYLEYVDLKIPVEVEKQAPCRKPPGGTKIPPDFNYCRPGEMIPEEEFEDSYNRYFKDTY